MISEKYETIFVGHGSKLAAVVDINNVHDHLMYIVQEKVYVKDPDYFAWVEAPERWYIMSPEECEKWWQGGYASLGDGRPGYNRLPQAFKAAAKQLEAECFLEST
jgi:hypothetical protein